ncbi:MAG TPA: hypothetical protein VF892_18025 [Pseudonocardiaceae bacterium]
MPATVLEIISDLLPESTADTDLVIERFDELHNPADEKLLIPTAVC